MAKEVELGDQIIRILLFLTPVSYTHLVLLYKRMEVQGRFRWSRNQLEVKQLTWQQFDWLMSGLEIEQPKAFKPTQ